MTPIIFCRKLNPLPFMVAAVFITFLSLQLAALAETNVAERRPEWVSQDSRRVIGGDILHVGTGIGNTPEVARFKAESMAVKNVISECTLAHRDLVIWDRYSETQPDSTVKAWARAGISFSACDEAKMAKGPARDRLTSAVLMANQQLYSELEGLVPEESLWNRFKARIYKLFGVQDKRISDAEAKLQKLEQKIAEIERAGTGGKTVVVHETRIISSGGSNNDSRFKDCMFDYQQQMDEAVRIANERGNPPGNLASPAAMSYYNRALQKQRQCMQIRGR